MDQVEQDIEALADDVVRRLSLDVRNEADTTGVVFIARVVEALALRKRHGSLFG
jgi:hypothetical protein